jgi:hypothetical protein
MTLFHSHDEQSPLFTLEQHLNELLSIQNEWSCYQPTHSWKSTLENLSRLQELGQQAERLMKPLGLALVDCLQGDSFEKLMETLSTYASVQHRPSEPEPEVVIRPQPSQGPFSISEEHPEESFQRIKQSSEIHGTEESSELYDTEEWGEYKVWEQELEEALLQAIVPGDSSIPDSDQVEEEAPSLKTGVVLEGEMTGGAEQKDPPPSVRLHSSLGQYPSENTNPAPDRRFEASQEEAEALHPQEPTVVESQTPLVEVVGQVELSPALNAEKLQLLLSNGSFGNKEWEDDIPRPEEMTAPQSKGCPKEGRKLLERVLEVLEEDPVYEFNYNRREERKALESLCSEKQLQQMAASPRKIHNAVLSLMVARLRALQDGCEGHVEDKTRSKTLEELFRLLAKHSKKYRPGSVHGLAREHEPEAGSSWVSMAASRRKILERLLKKLRRQQAFNPDDALRRLIEEHKEGMEGEVFVQKAEALVEKGVPSHETRLVNLATHYLDVLKNSAALSNLLRHAKQQLAEEEKQEALQASTLPSKWKWWECTRGKNVWIVGGDPRPEVVERLKSHFEFERLEWMPEHQKKGMNKIHCLTQRISSGNVDMVLVLRSFVSHSAANLLFEHKNSACDVVLVDRGYGQEQIRQAIERYCTSGADNSPTTHLQQEMSA